VRKGEKWGLDLRERRKNVSSEFQGAVINFHSSAHVTEWAGVDNKFSFLSVIAIHVGERGRRNILP